MTDPLTDLPVPDTDERPSAAFTANLKTRVEAIEARADRSRASRWHLAQLNLGLFKAPLDAPEMQPFVEALDRINALAEASPGFVWRLTDDEGASSSFVDVPGVDDPLWAPNLSVWTDLESLRNFMYRTDHANYLRRRAEWFQRPAEAITVAWWIPAGTVPTLADAVRRLWHLRANGPSDTGFPITRRIPRPPAGAPAPSTLTSESKNPHNQEQPMNTQIFIPYLAVKGAREAMQFYAEVFGAEQSGDPFDMDDGRIGHAEMTIGGQLFYLADEFPEMDLYQPGHERKSPLALVINVDDCDAVYEHAVAAGATGERPPTNQHGHRSGWFVDPWGHRWCPTSAEKPGQL